MCAATLTAKTPLPQDMPFAARKQAIADFVHDALVLSYRFAQTEEGRAAVMTGDVTRYWFVFWKSPVWCGWVLTCGACGRFYVLSLHSIFPQLDELEDVLEEMYGRLEESLHTFT